MALERGIFPFKITEREMLMFDLKRALKRAKALSYHPLSVDRRFVVLCHNPDSSTDPEEVKKEAPEEVKKEAIKGEGENSFDQGTRNGVQLHRSLIVIKKLSILYLFLFLFRERLILLLVIQIAGTYLYVQHPEYLRLLLKWALEEVWDPLDYLVFITPRILREFWEGSTSFRETLRQLHFAWVDSIYDLGKAFRAVPAYPVRNSPWNRTQFFSFLRAFWKEFQSDSGLEFLFSRKTIILSLAILSILWNLRK